ncbi:hypothetical protein K7X08_013397 [Anisodus acutangulus]|uniref:Tetratricopeptide repeat protein n=1 Tax=Anisodus acutangulus TaxID=402998 RepID=A0A9Q1MBN5_9SOLA|nr:hypothetical protein K7X08_013397 [Anisodus acutangulus]
MQFDEAENLCKKTLEIHRVHCPPASLEEAVDRRLMALIREAKGDYEAALEHLVLASMAMIANAQENEVAAIDLHLVFVRLADLYYKTGKLRESRSYCENALRIYAKPVPGTTAEEIPCGLTEISAIYELFNESEKALKLLEDKPGQQSTIAGIEAQMGVMFYMVGRYEEAHSSFENAVAKLRAGGERKSAFFGKQDKFWNRSVVLVTRIPFGVYSNLAAAYDALGRVEDDIEIL